MSEARRGGRPASAAAPGEPADPAEALREREKELDCVYALAALLTRPGIGLEEALAEAASAFAASLELPDRARVVARAGGLSAAFPRGADRPGSAWAVDEEAGARIRCSLRARYAAPGRRAFRERERLLARSIAALLANTAERLDAEARGAEFARRLELEGAALERKNAALSELISRIEEEKRAQRDRIRAAVESGTLTLVARLRGAEDASEARLLADRIESSLRAALTPGEPALDSRALLSPREREIGDLVAAGLTSKQIADRLSLALSTVERHRHNARRKLGAPGRASGLGGALGRPGRR